jgi:hypothetical protein
MIPDEVNEFWWKLNNLWYSVSVFIIRWLMPRGIREACCLGEIDQLRQSYPGQINWSPIDHADFEYNAKTLQNKYGAWPLTTET